MAAPRKSCAPQERPIWSGLRHEEPSVARRAEGQRALLERQHEHRDCGPVRCRTARGYRERKLLWSRRSVFDNTKDMTFLSSFFRGSTGKEGKFEDAVIDSLKALDRAVMLVGLRIDLRRLGLFEALTPRVIHFAGGTRRTDPRRGAPDPTEEDFVFCRDFVVTSALHLAAFDYDFDLWNAAWASVESRDEPPQADDPGLEVSDDGPG